MRNATACKNKPHDSGCEARRTLPNVLHIADPTFWLLTTYMPETCFCLSKRIKTKNKALLPELTITSAVNVSASIVDADKRSSAN
jgi:hypothetical protein